jgi:20S proteasome alpha/beta subunit
MLCRFLSYVDLVGVTYSAPSLATGFGAHLATPLLRKELDSRGPEGEKELTEEEAVKIVRNCMKVLFYRDARSLNKVTLTAFSSASLSRYGTELTRVARVTISTVPNRKGDEGFGRDWRTRIFRDSMGIRRRLERL